jgi:hypothetical protein
MDKDYNELVAFQTRRMFNVLAKKMLMMLEDLKAEHQIHFDKLRRNSPASFQAVIEQADYLDDAKFAHLRKRILDSTGESFREISDELEKYSLHLRR